MHRKDLLSMTAGDSMPRTPLETVTEENWPNIRAIVRKTYGHAAKMREPARLLAHNKASFGSVQIVIREESQKLISAWAPGRGLERFVAAADVTATKY
jgi:stage III sporulation protein SpoIIIAA